MKKVSPHDNTNTKKNQKEVFMGVKENHHRINLVLRKDQVKWLRETAEKNDSTISREVRAAVEAYKREQAKRGDG